VGEDPSYKGYNGFLSMNTDASHDGDLHEGFNFGSEEIRDSGLMSRANVWPDPSQLPGFKEPAMTY
jgi:hypothetical protein